jgi:HAD superfamily hydrolase (TIGR01450 family)
MAWVLDLDGVVWLAGEPIPGSPEAISRLRATGQRVIFLTNNSGPTLDEYVAMLAKAGVEAEADDLVTSAQAAASLLAPGSSAAVVGGDGVHEALARRGVKVVGAAAGPDAVVVGRSVKLDYDELAAASNAIRDGARFVATNSDSTYPTPHGPLPGAGALVAFVATAAGRQAEVAGKPHAAVAELVKARVGVPTVMVGDRPDTDGAFAAAVGAPFALVLSGSTGPDDVPTDPPPAVVGANLAEVVERLLAHSR